MKHLILFSFFLFLHASLFLGKAYSADLEQFKKYYIEAIDVKERVNAAITAKNEIEETSLQSLLSDLLLKSLEFNPRSPEVYALMCGRSTGRPQDTIEACYKAIEFKAFESNDIDVKNRSWNEEFYIYFGLANAYHNNGQLIKGIAADEKSVDSSCLFFSNEKMNELCPLTRGYSAFRLLRFYIEKYDKDFTKSKVTLNKIEKYVKEIDLNNQSPFLSEDFKRKNEQDLQMMKAMVDHEKNYARSQRVWVSLFFASVIIFIFMKILRR